MKINGRPKVDIRLQVGVTVRQLLCRVRPTRILSHVKSGLLRRITGITFLILIVFLWIGCNHSQEKKEYYGNGNLKSDSIFNTASKSINVKDYYENGSIKDSYNVTNGLKQGGYFHFKDDQKRYKVAGYFYNGKFLGSTFIFKNQELYIRHN